MGVCQSTEVKQAIVQNRQINQVIRQERKQRRIKLLLLGTADCGKSTILKQMRILHDNGFKNEELEQQKYVIYSNIVNSMHALIAALDSLGTVPVENGYADLIKDIVTSGRDRDPLSTKVATALRELWVDRGIQECFKRRAEFQINETAKYFLDDLKRISSPDYIPTTQDVLQVRIPTNGIVEVAFTIENVIFRVFDVGGQRSERRKWIHCFDDVDAIIFMTAISEYDQMLVEDERMNRIHESLQLFHQICNSEWFAEKTSMILFMNKKDLFLEKVDRIPITIAFPEYKGVQNYEDCARYIEQKFQEQNESNREIYFHLTCATDTNQVDLVMDSVLDTILQQNLQNAGLLVS